MGTLSLELTSLMELAGARLSRIQSIVTIFPNLLALDLDLASCSSSSSYSYRP